MCKIGAMPTEFQSQSFCLQVASVSSVIRELLKTLNRKTGEILLDLELPVMHNFSWKSLNKKKGGVVMLE